MWKTVLWLSLGITVGITSHVVYSHVTQVTVVATPEACKQALLNEAGWQGRWDASPQGHLPVLSK